MQGTHLRYAIKFVADMEKAVKFYRDVVGLQLKFESPGWSEFVTGETTLALHPASEKSPAGRVELGFTVADVEASYREMSAKDVLFSMPPKKQDFGGLLAQFVDSEGAHLQRGRGGSAASSPDVTCVDEPRCQIRNRHRRCYTPADQRCAWRCPPGTARGTFTVRLDLRHRSRANPAFGGNGARLDDEEANRAYSLVAFDVWIAAIRLLSSFSGRQPRSRSFAARECMGNRLCPHGVRIAHHGGDWSLRRHSFPLDC
jgi:lactoylglutathione lyase